MITVNITIEHDIVRAWAERTGARPSTCEGDERPWPLMFDFGVPNAGLKEISWQTFFEEFERVNVAFVYRNLGPNDELDDFHQFVNRAAVPELAVSGKSTITERVI